MERRPVRQSMERLPDLGMAIPGDGRFLVSHKKVERELPGTDGSLCCQKQGFILLEWAAMRQWEEPNHRGPLFRLTEASRASTMNKIRPQPIVRGAYGAMEESEGFSAETDALRSFQQEI